MNAQLIELLILIAIAGFVLFKLKSVIGTRTGHEAPPEYLTRDKAVEGAAIPTPLRPVPSGDDATPDTAVPEEFRAALSEIARVEPGFSLEQFLDGARGAYEMILMAYEEGDRATLKGLLTRDVYAAFDSGIGQREAEGVTVEARFIGVRDARVTAVQVDPATREAEVTIRFVGELITAVRDAENRVVEGDPNEIRRQTDVWTFTRKLGARDPNWLLSSTGE